MLNVKERKKSFCLVILQLCQIELNSIELNFALMNGQSYPKDYKNVLFKHKLSMFVLLLEAAF